MFLSFLVSGSLDENNGDNDDDDDEYWMNDDDHDDIYWLTENRGRFNVLLTQKNRLSALALSWTSLVAGKYALANGPKRNTTKGLCNTICPWMWSIVGAESTRPNCSSLMHLCPAVLFCSRLVPISAPTRDCRKKRAARLPECHKLLSTNLWNHFEELCNKHFILLQLFVLNKG